MFRSKKRTSSHQRHQQLAIESLEDRRLLVLGAFDIPSVVPANGGYDGVVRTANATGTLLSTGRHILTSEHVGETPADSIPKFELLTPIGQIREIQTPIRESYPHPDVDLKVHELAELAPLTAHSWDIYRDGDEVGRRVTLVGYGDTGTGTTGNVSSREGSLQITTEVARLTIDPEVVGGFFLLSQEGGGGVAVTLPHDPNANEIRDAVLTLTGADQVDVRLVGDISPFNNGNVEHTGHPHAGAFEIVITMVAENLAAAEAADFEVDNLVVSDFANGGDIRIETLLEGGGRREKRLAYNDIGGADITWLYADFDNATEFVDQLGLDDGRGLGVFEGFHTIGDSGSPVFIDGQIAGVHKGRFGAGVDGQGQTADFGEIERYLRVSTYQHFIDPILEQSYPLVLDMRNQPWGDDGWDDTIEFSRNGGMLEIWIGGTLRYTDSISQIESVEFQGSGDNERITFSALGDGIPINIHAADGDDTIRLDGLSNTEANIGAGTGVDRIVVGNNDFANNIKGSVRVVGDAPGNDTLVIADRNSGGNRGYGIRPDRFQTTAYSRRLSYSYIGTFQLEANEHDNAINLFGTDPGTDIVIHANGGADRINIGDDDLTSNLFRSSVRIVGGLGHDQLFLNDESSSHPNGVHTLRATKYEKTASDTETEIEFFTVNEIELNTGTSAEIVHVRGTSQYTHDLRVDMGNSDDQVNIHRTHENTHLYVDLGGGSDLVELSPNTRDLDSIGGTVEVNMRYGANDRILLNDDLDAGEDYYNLWMSRFDKTGFSELVFDNADVVDLRANADENIINIRELHQDVDLNVHAGGGDDSIRVGTVHYDLDSYLPGGLSLEGGAGRDLAVFYDQSDTGSDAYRISATAFSKTGTQEWPIASVEVLTLNANEYTNHVHVGAIDGATDRLNINVRGGDDEIFLGTIYNRLDQLQGEIVVNGGIGLNRIHALDSRSGGPRAYTFEDETFDTSGSFGTLDFRSIASLRVIADDYDDEFHVRSLNATTDLDLRGSDGDDQVQLVDVLNDLSSVIAFAGGAGTDRIHIDDSLAFTGQSYNLNANAFHRGNGLSVEFDENLELLDLNGTAHVDLFRVLSAPLGSIPIQVDLAGGRDVVFGPNEVSDWRVRDLNSVRFGANVEFLGTEEVVGGNAVDNFVVLPGALQSDSTPVTVNGGVGSSIDVLTTPSSVRAEVSLEDGTINDVLSFSGVERLRGNHHNDRLTGKNVENVWRVSGSNSGSVQTAGQSDTVRFTNFESLLGGTETDRFLLQEGGSISGPINGRQGRDWIDYRNRTSGVFVDLSGDLATDIGTPVSIENVHGGQGRDLIVGDEKRNILRGEAGHDVLVGMTGNDLIFGDEGRDVMIGGIGPDQLYGFSGEDILIGGWTGYDSSASDLNTLSEIWSNPNSVFEVRVEQLHNGKGGVEVSKETVTDDGQVDQLFGQGDMDWLWEGVGDELVQDGRTAGPTLNSSQSSSAADQQLAALASGVFVAVDSTSDEILFAQDRFPSETGLDSGLGNLASFSWTNASNRFDVNDDDALTPLDALLIINFLNRSSGLLPELSQQPSEFLDVSQDGHATPLDALAVINQLNKRKDSVFFAESEDEEDSQERL